MGTAVATKEAFDLMNNAETGSIGVSFESSTNRNLKRTSDDHLEVYRSANNETLTVTVYGIY